MRFSDFPFLRYLPFILAGILVGKSSWCPGLIILAMILSVIWLGYVIFVSVQSKGKTASQSSPLAYLALILFGALIVQSKKDMSAFNPDLAVAEAYLAEVTMYDQQKPNSFENLLEIKSIQIKGTWKDAHGKILVYHQSDRLLKPGEILYAKSKPEQIAAPTNPYEFDYRKYLFRQEIYYRQFLGKDFQLIDSVRNTTAKYFLVDLRHKIGEMLKSRIPDSNSAQIALALLLGQKKELDPTIRDAYTQAGVMHVLAVSGLHVGIIYALFILMLKPLKLKLEKARFYLLGVILVIWMYAFLTGLAPSVVRAATMFSLLTLGQMRERPPAIYNVLAFSAILMITVNPDVIFEVGFQLSYLAVLGIVMLQPLILDLWLPRTRVVEYVWELASVSIAAQLVTFPLTLYYFHVFPTYFLLGNLLILPLALLIMQVGVPLMMVGWIPVVGDVLGWALSWLIWLQIRIAEMIRLIPGGKLERLTMDFAGMIFVWGILLIVVAWQFGQRNKLVWLALFLTFVLLGNSVYKEFGHPARELIVYQGKKSQLFDFYSSGMTLSWNSGLDPGEISYSVDPNRVQNHWPQIPGTLKVFQSDSSKVEFVGADFSFLQQENRLVWASPPKSIYYWCGNSWQSLPVSDSLRVDSLAYRIVF